MDVLGETREKIRYICEQRKVTTEAPVTVRCLSPQLGVGEVDEGVFGFCRGRDAVIEAEVAGARGQAFTHEPQEWTGTLDDVFNMSLATERDRAIVVAALNALAGRLDLSKHVIHCRKSDPSSCGPELVHELRRRFPEVSKVFLVGLQPAVLKALVADRGVGNVRVVDHDPQHVNDVRHGVIIGDGDADIADDIAWCDVMLVTGSSVVNGTLDELLDLSGDAAKPVLFFGNTIAAVAAVADLERICPLGQH